MKPIRDPVDIRARLTAEQFHAHYLYPERPVVITDLCTDWPASDKWTNDYLVRRFGDYPLSAYYHPEGLYTAWKRMRVDTTLGAVITGGDPRTFASADFFPECPYLIDDIRVPSLVRAEWIEDEASLWIQPRGHRTGLHWDSFNSLISVIRGRKRVLLFSPDQIERLYPCHVTGSRDFSRGSWSRMDVFEPDFEQFPAAREASYHEVFVEPGQSLLIPRHWWHAVENLGTPTIAVSFFITPQGKPELTFYYDRRLIAGLSIKVGVLTGTHAA
ncbi:MAG: cupin-like domain-containing protein [Deltaproteobacteria bacterium]|nr:cupin-like domain-containing protein [Deltaproteobacteria bacterium]